MNRSLRYRPRTNWNRQRDERRAFGEPSGNIEYEFPASLHEGASCLYKVREYIKHRKHLSR